MFLSPKLCSVCLLRSQTMHRLSISLPRQLWYINLVGKEWLGVSGNPKITILSYLKKRFDVRVMGSQFSSINLPPST